jgi:putative membrane protein
VWNLLLQIVSGILGLWLAQRYVAGVDFTGPLFVLPKQTALFGQFLNSLVFVGGLLGILNYFVKPILNKITFPLRIVTLNLFSLLIAMFLVWLVDIFSQQLIIQGLKPLFLTTLIAWGLSLILTRFWPAKSPSYNR